MTTAERIVLADRLTKMADDAEARAIIARKMTPAQAEHHFSDHAREVGVMFYDAAALREAARLMEGG